METTLINHPRLKVRVETGSEGPRYDPYAFKETTIKANGKKVVLHEGLGDWLKIDDQEVEPPKFIGKFPITYREQAASAWRRAVVEVVAGYSLEQIERIAASRDEAAIREKDAIATKRAGDAYLMDRCGDADGIFGLWGKFTWKADKNGKRVSRFTRFTGRVDDE